MILASTIIVTIERLGEGPTEQNGDWRGMARRWIAWPAQAIRWCFIRINSGVRRGCIISRFRIMPRILTPVMFLNEPADADALQALSKYPRVWLVGPEAAADGKNTARVESEVKQVVSEQRIDGGDAEITPAAIRAGDRCVQDSNDLDRDGGGMGCLVGDVK